MGTEEISSKKPAGYTTISGEFRVGMKRKEVKKDKRPLFDKLDNGAGNAKDANNGELSKSEILKARREELSGMAIQIIELKSHIDSLKNGVIDNQVSNAIRLYESLLSQLEKEYEKESLVNDMLEREIELDNEMEELQRLNEEKLAESCKQYGLG